MMKLLWIFLAMMLIAASRISHSDSVPRPVQWAAEKSFWALGMVSIAAVSLSESLRDLEEEEEEIYLLLDYSPLRTD